MTVMALSAALRETGQSQCQSAATLIDASSGGPFDLHLRNAALTEQRARAIALALSRLGQDRPKLRSFSISYNPSIGDDAAKSLLLALPVTVQEVGMVGCGLNDESGEDMLEWAQRATLLRMMCVERNHFSPEIRSKLVALGRQKAGPTIFA